MSAREVAFRRAVSRLRVSVAGTEAVAPLLAALIELRRPRRVLEVGMGYTTPFLAEALAYMRQTLAYRPPFPLRMPAISTERGDVDVPGGPFEQGSPDDGTFVFDNDFYSIYKTYQDI